MFAAGDEAMRIASVNMDEEIGKEGIAQMPALGYTHEAIAIGLTPNEIEMPEAKGTSTAAQGAAM